MSKKRRRSQQPTQTRRTVPSGGTPIPAAMVRNPELFLQPAGATPAGQSKTPGIPKDAIQQQVTQNQAPQRYPAQLLPPGAPLRPIPGIETPEGPRGWQYPLDYNVNTRPRSSEGVSFDALRSLAQVYQGIQLAEAVWFDVLARLEPRVTMKPGIIPDGESDTDAKWAKQLLPARDWLKKPDMQMRLSAWLTASVRDLLELGTSLIWKRRNKAGEIVALDVLDPALWKILVDQRGRIPNPPYPAYLQIVNGIPAGWYTTENMILMEETGRSDSVYPISRVEKILITIHQALRHQDLNLARYTDGSVPEGLVEVKDPAGDPLDARWEEVEHQLNGLLAGNTTIKSRIKILPPGLGNFKETRPDDPKTEYDRWLLNITAAAFGVTMDELGITDTSNRSVGDSQENVIYRRVVRPVAHLYQELLTEILQEKFQDDRLVLEWGGIEEPEDELKKAQTYDIAVKNGAISPSTFARLMKLPVEEEIPPFVSVQGGVGSIVTMDMVGKATQYLEEDRAQAKAQKDAATQQQQLIDAQMQKQAKQQDEESSFGGFGEEEGNQGKGGAEGEEPPPAPKGGGAKGAKSSSKNATPEESSGNEDDAATEVDNLIENAKSKGKTAKRMQGADDDDTGMDGGRRGDLGRGDTERGGRAAYTATERLRDDLSRDIYDGQDPARSEGTAVLFRQSAISADVTAAAEGDSPDGEYNAQRQVAAREWAAWYAKSLKAAKAGLAQPVWRADALPASLAAYAQERLQGVVTPDDVRAVFAEVRRREGEPVRLANGEFGGWVGGAKPTDIPDFSKMYGQDITDYLARRFPHIQWNLDRMDSHSAAEAIPTILHLAQLYPGPFHTLTHVDMRGFGGIDLEKAMAYVQQKPDGTTQLHLNPLFFGDHPSLHAEVMTGTVNGWLAPDGAPGQHVITHEFGHIVDHWMQERANAAWRPMTFPGGFGEIHDLPTRWMAQNGRPILAVSRYGKTSPREAFAEAFLAAHHPDPNGRESHAVFSMRRLLSAVFGSRARQYGSADAQARYYALSPEQRHAAREQAFAEAMEMGLDIPELNGGAS